MNDGILKSNGLDLGAEPLRINILLSTPLVGIRLLVEVKSDAGLHCNRKCPLKEHVALIYDMTRSQYHHTGKTARR